MALLDTPVAVIGIGNMGLGMALRLRDAVLSADRAKDAATLAQTLTHPKTSTSGAL